MDLITTQQAPTLISLSTTYSSKPNNANSRNTFSVLNPISTRTDQDFGQVALTQMSGTNSIVNIPSEVTLQLKATWFNELLNIEEFSITDIFIPPGHYSYSTMLAFLNGSLPTFADEPYPDTVYGLGGTAVPSPLPTNVPVSKSEINTKFIFSQYADILTQVFVGPAPVNEHVYRTFEIVFTASVYRLFVMLGLSPLFDPLNFPTSFTNYVIQVNKSSEAYDVGTNLTTVTYNVQNQIMAPFTFNFASPQCLYVYIESPVNSQFRSPFNQNNPSNLIARVPINTSFGFQFSYSQQNLIYSQQKNLNISQIAITCRDEYNELVDFQNTPWFIELAVKFAMNENAVPVSGTDGVPKQISNLPTVHSSAVSYNDPSRRDVLGSQSQNNSTVTLNAKRSKRDGF
jgi:hypothetical protein